ncbi:PREDICTED: calcium uptake protein 2, mitochondrial-like, partial [Galeopterus variegatus]|uniref:Calcium uptake protein 2, mitochondrial-like n=1 Tax=Galeopterus variegatus TaxID=482537 RepID=A0ABM0S596_GALVR
MVRGHGEPDQIEAACITHLQSKQAAAISGIPVISVLVHKLSHPQRRRRRRLNRGSPPAAHSVASAAARRSHAREAELRPPGSRESGVLAGVVSLAAGRRAVPGPGPLAAAVAGVALVGAAATWHQGRVNVAAREGSLTVFAQKNVDHGMIGKLSLRKWRFMQFSSLEHEGEYYMTPRDFLFAVMFEQMERKTLVKKLTKKDIEDALAGIRRAGCGSTFFRDLGDKGLISYTEYIFLLTILTKPHSGFHVAFKMLDADGNEMIEKKEFFK